MTRRFFIFRDGKAIEVFRSRVENRAPYIHTDTIDPIRHMVTGEVFDSRSAYLRRCEELGCKVVGNDLLSEQKHQLKEVVTEEKIMDAVEKAESIVEDPFKWNQRVNQNIAARSEAEKLLGRS